MSDLSSFANAMATFQRGGLLTGRRYWPVVLLALTLWPATPSLAQSDIFSKAMDSLFGSGDGAASALTTDEIAGGLREALRVGSDRVVTQVSQLDGFNRDASIHIPLPGVLGDVQSTLKTIGMSGLADDLELKINRAAETAAPEARELFFQAISEMTLDDARGIYEGPDDSATQYFKGKTVQPLSERMSPIVDASLAKVGAIASYDRMMSSYKTVPFVPDVKADLTSYVVEKALDGIFYYVAKEEAAIRNNPTARSTELLRKVFGSG